MKRRNVDLSKLRRPPVKQSKPRVADGIYQSLFMNMKLLSVWATILLVDFFLEFRFEYLWPIWLLMRSLYDSYKFQGIAFSMFFLCITITSDIVCYLFVPVQLLFFTASTYVWVQYVWQTERGFCLPTILLWVLFIYVEAAVRLRELKSLPHTLNLCRPFAAHCVGYPVITLGFSARSSISNRFRLRRQREIQKENQFYMQLLDQALPPPPALPHAASNGKSLQYLMPNPSPSQPISNGAAYPNHATDEGNYNAVAPVPSDSVVSTSSTRTFGQLWSRLRSLLIGESTQQPDVTAYDDDEDVMDDSCEEDDSLADIDGSMAVKDISSNGSGGHNSRSGANDSIKGIIRPKKIKAANLTSLPSNNIDRDLVISRLESDIKRIKSDLQIARNLEQELRSQIANLSSSDRTSRLELNQLRLDNENLQNKLHKQVTSRQQEKQNLAIVERRLVEERKQKLTLENQLATEKRKKAEENANALRCAAPSPTNKCECTLDSCKNKMHELDVELVQLKQELKTREERVQHLERETQALQQYRESQSSEVDALMSALSSMQEKNNQLEVNLSAETRLKLDLFSALGDAKRQIEIQQGMLIQKEVELADLKSRMCEVMSCIPSSIHSFAQQQQQFSNLIFSSAPMSPSSKPSSTISPQHDSFTQHQ